MTTAVVLILLAIAQAAFGRPIYADAFYDLGDAPSSIVVSRFPVTAPN